MRSYKYILFILALLTSAGMQGQYNPTNPSEPGVPSVYYTLTLEASPSGGGSFNLGTTTSYSEGTKVNLRAYTNSYFSFIAWEQDGEVISTSSSFTYTMPAKNVKLIAHYKYDPSNPEEPTKPNIPVYSTLYLSASPSSGGYFNINSGNKYEVGSAVSLRAYNNSNFSFKNWTENGEVISTSSSFQYVMKEGNPTLVANFTYNPGNPEEPTEAQSYRKLYLKSNPSGGGYFNISSGNEYQECSTVYVRAYSNQWYSFKNWTNEEGNIVSTSSSFNLQMPKRDFTLTANYTYNYNPSNPDEPNKPSSEQVNIYGMTENGVRGQTIIYPIYLENTSEVKGIVVDVQFPKDFLVQTGSVSLSGRCSGHEMGIKELGNNDFRFSLIGDEVFFGNNGKIFEVPIIIPDTVTMGHIYPVILTHGVMQYTDGSQTDVSVRNGSIYIEKISEDGLYARFQYDKLLNRVQFTNLSSNNAQSYAWDFGDGTTSTEKNPLHTYAKSGYYTITLAAKGEVDTDIAEQTILINNESSWSIEGTFYLSDEEKGVRYFTSADSLFKFIAGSPLSGNVKIAIPADGEYTYPLTDTNTTSLENLQSSLSDGSFTLSLSKNGVGRNPILLLGELGGSIDKSFIDFFILLGRNLACEDVDLNLWGVSFNPTHIGNLNNQIIPSGAKTTEVDFTSISTDLNFTWTLTSVPTNATGFQTTGEGAIPSMTIINEGESNCNLIYNIIGTHGGSTFCEFTYTIIITPTLVGQFSSLSPAKGYVSESTTVTLTWNKIINAVYDVYLWNAANQRPTTPVEKGTTGLNYTSHNFCQNGNTYKWQIVARYKEETLVSDTMSFIVRADKEEYERLLTALNEVVTYGEDMEYPVNVELKTLKDQLQQKLDEGTATSADFADLSTQVNAIRQYWTNHLADDDLALLITGKTRMVNSETTTWETPWDLETEVLSLDGVSITGGRVSAIDLSNRGLTGTFPAALMSLKKVTSLNLSGNSLTGNIGVDGTVGTSLTFLNVSGNRFESVSPALPSNLTVYLTSQQIPFTWDFDLSQMEDAETLMEQLPSILFYNHSLQSLTNHLTLKAETGDGWQMTLSYENGNIAISSVVSTPYMTANNNELTITSLTGDASGSTFSMRLRFDQGDANFTGDVNVLDLQTIIGYIFNDYTKMFNYTAANLYVDDRINVQDVVRMVDILLEDNEEAGVKAFAFGHPKSMTELEPQATLYWRNNELVLDTEVPVAAADIRIAGSTVTWNLQKQGFTVTEKKTGTGSHSIIYSLSGAEIPVGENVIATRGENASGIVTAMLSSREGTHIPVAIVGQDETRIDKTEIAGHAWTLTSIGGAIVARGIGQAQFNEAARNLTKGIYILNSKQQQRKLIIDN